MSGAPIMRKPSIADCIKLQMDFIYSNPDLIVQALIGANDRGTRDILRECQRRKIDIGPALERYFRKSEKLWGETGVTVSAGRIRIPIGSHP